MDLARFAIEKRLISALATLLILCAGYFAYLSLPRFEDPEFLIRQAQIITPYPGASSEATADEVTDVIENALQQLQGVKEIRSTSTPGLSEVMVEFTIAAVPDRNALNTKFTQMRAKIRDVQNRLPPGAQPTQVYDDFGDVYALYFAITGEGYSLPDLEGYAKQLQRELVLVDGVSKVVITGAPQQVIYVEYNPAKLAQLGLSSQSIAQVLDGQNSIVPAGSVKIGTSRIAIRPDTVLTTPQAIGELTITGGENGASFRLSDIASVRSGFKEPDQRRLFSSGQPAIGLGISNTLGGNVVNMGDAVKARMTDLVGDRPLGIEITPISDQSTSVKASVADFVMNVVLALAIVVGTLLIFMGLRSGILMGGILLVTVAGTLFGMYLYGLDMQRISLGALIIALGMLVDNAIVVVEGTLVRVQRGESPASASIAVVKQTKWPLLGGTIVGFLAFSPIGFSPDNTGEYASSLFWTITIALLFSWLVAVWLAPYFCTLLLKPPKEGFVEPRENIILRAYRRLLRLALKVRWITVVAVLALFVSAVVSFRAVPQGFFPESTRAQFVVDYTLPAGTSIDTTTADIRAIEDWLVAMDGVVGTRTVIGGGHQRFMLVYAAESADSSYGQILVDVEDYTKIAEMIPVIQDHINETYPASLTKVWKFVLGPGGGSLIEARFYGPDGAVLRELAEKSKAIFAAEGAISVKDDWRGQVKRIVPQINEAVARRIGLTQGDISNALAGYFDGESIGVYRDGTTLNPIIFRPALEFRDRAEKLRSALVFSPALGRSVPISQVVDGFDIDFEDGRILRVNRSLAITAQADPPPGQGSGPIFERIKPQVDAIELPQEYSLEWEGQYGDSQQANAGLAATMPIGFGAMIIVVLMLFNAVRQPLIIFLTVPLALIGVVYGLVALKTPLEFMAILGVLSLTGMLIKNAIVLIDETDTQIAEGKARMAAVIDAAVSRVRPVSLGVLTTVLGVIPLLWDPFFKSLSVVIICGLSFATILTLIVVPVLYAIFFHVGFDEDRKPEKKSDPEPTPQNWGTQL